MIKHRLIAGLSTVAALTLSAFLFSGCALNSAASPKSAAPSPSSITAYTTTEPADISAIIITTRAFRAR